MHLVYSITHRQERGATWRDLIAQWQISKLSRADFCRQQQLHLKDFRRWMYRLRSMTEVAENKSAFVPVQIVEPAAAATLTLQHRSGFTLLIHQQTDAALFKQVAAWLQEATC